MLVFNSTRNGLLNRIWSPATGNVRSIMVSPPLTLQLTPCLMGEPLKKRKKLDPALVRAREERRKRKIEKEIRKIEKLGETLKPIEELRIPSVIHFNKRERIRKIEVQEEVLENRIHVQKAWCRANLKAWKHKEETVLRLIAAQEKALNELKLESEELYKAAIQLDETLIPFSFKGPVETPPIENYEPPNGDYFDISKDWSKEIA